jgi:hypothetical protein
MESNIQINPETGKVDYGNYRTLIKLFNEFLTFYKTTFLKDPKVQALRDPQFLEIFKNSRYSYSQFVNNLKTNHPEEYAKIEPIIQKQIRENSKVIDENVVRDLVRKALEEENSTGAGADAGSFMPGESANYAPKFAYNPNKKAKGAKNIYYYKLGFKPVNTKKLEETEESSQSYVDSLNLPKPALKQFIETRITDFDKIEDKINELLPLLKKAKTETMEYYKMSPDFQIKYGTDLAVDYLNDLITLFKDKK